jgi:hypothetical protein
MDGFTLHPIRVPTIIWPSPISVRGRMRLLQHPVAKYTRHDDSIARFDELDRLAHFLHDAQAFVTKCPGRFATPGDDMVDVHVRAADGGRGEADDGVF